MDKAIFILGIVEIIICVVCFFFKQKWQFLVCLLSYNIILLVEYLLKQDIACSFIIGIDILKNIVFYIFAKRNLKPNLALLIILEIISLIISIITWQNWYSLLLLFASILGTFSQWQDDMKFLRIASIFVSLLCIINYIFNSFYTTAIAESISMVSALISVFVFYVFPKRTSINKNKEEMETKDIEQK